MAKFLYIVALETDREDAEEFIERIRSVASVGMLKDIEQTPVGLSQWAVGDLVPLADSVDVNEAIGWLS